MQLCQVTTISSPHKVFYLIMIFWMNVVYEKCMINLTQTDQDQAGWPRNHIFWTNVIIEIRKFPIKGSAGMVGTNIIKLSKIIRHLWCNVGLKCNEELCSTKQLVYYPTAVNRTMALRFLTWMQIIKSLSMSWYIKKPRLWLMWLIKYWKFIIK